MNPKQLALDAMKQGQARPASPSRDPAAVVKGGAGFEID